ncbi:TPA: YtxH domain-containing protein, partial [Clostridioides difficile]
TQTAYAVHSAKEKAKSSVSDFKRGVVQEQENRQSGRLEKQQLHRQNIADKRMELQKAQEARQAGKKTDGSATSGATRPHERPATTSKGNVEKQQEVKRPATASKVKNEEVKANVVKERPLSSGGSSAKTVNEETTRQNYKSDRVTKTQTTTTQKQTQQNTEKNKRTLFKKGQRKK